MSEEMMVNMITNCAKMEAGYKLLIELMKRDLAKGSRDSVLLNEDELNQVLIVAGYEPIEVKEKDPTPAE